jgi:hypothetical protein
MFSWLEALGLTTLLAGMRSMVKGVVPHLPEWVLFSVPDALWLYALTITLAYLWWDHPSWLRFFMFMIGPSLAIGHEFAQSLGVFRGTFDPVDLILYIFSSILAIVVVKLKGGINNA